MFSPAQNTSYAEMSLHARGLIVSWALNNRGVVVDDWKKRAVEREDQWKDLNRYTIDAETGEAKEWDVAVKEREARESYWNYYAPDVGRIRGYIPAVPAMRGPSTSARPSSAQGDDGGKAFDEAVAKTARDGVGKKEGDGASAQATSFWSRYMPSSISSSSSSSATSTSTTKTDASAPASASQPSKEEGGGANAETTAEAPRTFTSYLWSPDTGISSSSEAGDNKDKANSASASSADPAVSQSWLSYGRSYLPTGRSRSGSRPSTPTPTSTTQKSDSAPAEAEAQQSDAAEAAGDAE